jgi:hypothetical protein
LTGEWQLGAPGVVKLPSGRRIRGRGLRNGLPAGPAPTLTVHLTGSRPTEPSWESRWVKWWDFWLPADPDDALRTGTGLTAMCVFEGMEPAAAVGWARQHYHPRTVEVPWQRRFLRHVRASTS